MKSQVIITGVVALATAALIYNIVSTDRSELVNDDKTQLINTTQEENSPVQYEAEVLAPAGLSKLVYESQNINTGVIGINPETNIDDPHDNTFHVYLDGEVESGRQAWLEYDLYGAEDYTSVSRAINDQIAIGGAFIKLSQEWSAQSEKIDASRLHKGDNIIRFSIPGNNDFNYIVKNVRIRFDESVDMSRRIVLNQPLSKSYYNRYGYISGFVSGKGSENAKIYANGKQIRSNQAAFEGLVDQIASSGTDWKAVITAVFADGQVISDTARFCNPAVCDFTNELETDIAYNESMVTAQLPIHLNVPGFELNGEPGSVTSKVKMSVTALRSQDMPLPRLSMVNVTGGSDGFRCLPHGNLFAKEVEVRIKYDTARIPKGYGPKDIRTFYYSEEQNDWIMLPYDTFDLATNEIVSHTNHFTDFINAILKTPESPQTQAFTPTSMKDMKYADPIAHINMMSPPQANNSGTANLSYPIQIPAGRQGMQPQLAISYSSEGGNSWLGVGWSMNIPSISVETRWGVPHYYSDKESESYLVNGEQIVELDSTDRLKPVHRDDFRARSTDTAEYFSYRVEGAFDEIIRHGTSTSTYWWEVVDKQGVRYFYGKYFSDTYVNPNCVLKDSATGNIAQWALAEVRDLNGNAVKYFYSIDKRMTAPGLGGVDIYPDSIKYTGNNATEGKYKVAFSYYDNGRSDYMISGRYGFLQVTDRLLKQVTTYYNNQFVNAYAIKYDDGAYNKKVICSITEVSDESKLSLAYEYTCSQLADTRMPGLKVHSFEYYNETTQSFDSAQILSTYLDDLSWNMLNNLFELPSEATVGYNLSNGKSFGGSLNVGLMPKVFDKSNSLGGNYTYSTSSSGDKMMIADINGDGLPDKIFQMADGIYYRKLVFNGNDLEYYSNPVKLVGLPGMGKTSSSSDTWGLEGQILFVGASYAETTTSNITPNYFSDVNADGLIDFICDGKVYYNSINSNGDPEFTVESSSETQYILGDTCSYIIRSGTVNDSIYTPFEATKVDLDNGYFRDGVRIWIAPYTGTVELNSNIQLVEDTSYSRQQSTLANGIRYIIQHNGNILTEDRVYASNYNVHNYQDTLSVTKGDRLYFRLQSMMDRSWDDVIWDPQISYTSIGTVVDADNKKIGIFKPSEDLLINNKQNFQAPYSGKVILKGTMTSAALSDTLVFRIKHGMTVIKQSTFPDNTSINYSLFDSLVVAEGDTISFEAFTSSNVNWNGIDEDFRIYYYFADSVTIDTNSLYNRIEVRPMVHYNLFQDARQRSYSISLAAGTYLFKPAFTYSGTVNDTITATVKSSGNLIAKQKFRILNNAISGTNSFNFTLPATTTIYVDYFTDNNSTSNYISSAKFTLNNQTTKRTAGLFVQMPDSMWKFGNLYRGWGQFSYYYSYDTTGTADPIIEASLHLSALYTDTTLITFDTTNISCPDSAISALSANGLNRPNRVPFNIMFPNLDSMEWRDYAQLSSVGPETMSNSNILITTTDTVYDSPIIVSTDPNVPMRVIRLANQEKNEAYSVSADISVISGGYAWNNAQSGSLAEYRDLNGDQYPDIVGREYVQFSTSQGGLSPYVTHLLSGNLETSSSEGNGVSAGVNLPISKSSNIKVTDFQVNSVGMPMKLTIRNSKKKSFLTGGASVYNSESEGNFLLEDMNGDGLPDKINKSNGKIYLSKGYSYSGGESWSMLKTNEDDISSTDFSIGYGQQIETELQNVLQNGTFNKREYSWSGGVSLGFSNSEQQYGLMDMNNDGITDIVAYVGGSSLLVYINNGNGANNNPNTWSDGGNINTNKTVSGSANISGSAGAPVFVVKIVGGLQGSISGCISMQKLTIADINNDGYPDIVYADSLSTQVMYSKMGKVNLLKQVKTPVESKYIVDYTLSKCDLDKPSRQWDMSSLKVYDGYAGDGQDTTYQKFEYADGYYDRFERTFYGYDTVITKQFNNFSPSGYCYRSTIERYINDDFLFKGLKKYEVIRDGSGNKYVETKYTWKKLEISTGVVVTSELCFGPYYPGVVQEDKYFYEGLSAYQIHTKKTYSYGPYGNVDEYVNFGDTTNATHKITADITYVYNTSLHLLSMVDQLDVYDYNNTLIQRRTGDYNNYGNITKIGSYNGSNYAYTEFDYDAYGNIISVLYPPDVNNERLGYTYEYETDVRTYPNKVTDFWGNYSQTWYDLRLGVVTKERDLSNNHIEYSYYSDGKLKTVTGPNEILNNIPYTIKFEYWDEIGDSTKWARSRHYDPMNSGNEFITVNFSDGLGRSIQSKQKVTIDGTDSMVVSGKTYYDAYGRAYQTSLPVTQALGPDSVLLSLTPTLFATSTFDILDRPLVQTAFDNTDISFSFGFGTDAFGNTAFSTTITDPNNKVTTRFSDARGLNMSATAPLTTITKFYYDPLGRMIQSTDPESVSTYYNYDMLGRLTSRVHPDAGTTSYTYDLAGNVLTTQTANLSSGSQYIHYNYAHARLSSIEYPQNPEMNVYYEYGSANSGTQSGRLVKQQDASGIQTFEYGNMGELVRNIHTFVVPGGVPYTFETRWKFDSWNRMDSIYYPDGEVVTYHYDNGGNLVSMDGVKGSQNFAYVNDVRYNKYGSRTRIDYGNSTYAQYTYNPLNQRLTNLKSYDNLSNLMQDIAYTYDDASNITAIENTAGYVNGDLGGICVNYYTYDDLYRLTNAEGAFVSYNNSTLYHSLEMSYSASGNILSKDVYAEKEIGGGVQTVNYSNTYQYGDRPHNVTSAGNYNYEWDANGNQIVRGNGSETRRLCWDEENRLTTVRDNGEQGVLSSYIYNAGGERIWKLTGDAYDMYVNGQYVYGGVGFSKTLYSSPYVVLTDEEYTKHYYIEGERICSKIGGGFALADIDPISTPLNFLVDDADKVSSKLWDMVRRGVDCTGFPAENVESKKELRSAENQNDDEEINQYYYHPDHLGSSSFITDATGTAIQHLEYLPYGELWVNQQSGSFDSRYKFSAKELDDETSYSYFGARYYDSDLSVWLSVDPMSDAFPTLSPYCYVGNNPINGIDKDGAFFEELKNWTIGRGWVTNGAHQAMKNSVGPMGANSAHARKATNNVTEVTYYYTNEETGKEEMSTALYASKHRNAMKFKDAYVIESKWNRKNSDKNAWGITFPGSHIKVGFGQLGNEDLINHEHGHWRQWQALGNSLIKFYWKIGIPSLMNAAFGGVMHAYHHTEVDADRRAAADGYTFSNSTLYPTDYSNVSSESGLINKLIFPDPYGTYYAESLNSFKRYYVRQRNFRKFDRLINL